MHRLMHTKHVWRTHRWHHSPEHIYWLAGVRASLAQQILFTLPTIAVLPLLAGMPAWVFAALLVVNAVWNHWQHVNVAWRSSWLEVVVVTPRFHHIHHASDAALHDTNFGTVFTIWDRMFGTFRSPDEHVPKKFGTGEAKRDPVLMMIGL
jgi:sterol desaturase/sphingolipid hydroxylase (fatty acid hydroxylase superfamily)